MNIQDSLVDFGFYSAHDAIKKKGLPDMKQLGENFAVPLGWHMIFKTPLKQLETMIPTVGSEYMDEVTKFLGEVSLMYGWRWAMGKDKSVTPILLKQLLTQGGQIVWNQVV